MAGPFGDPGSPERAFYLARAERILKGFGHGTGKARRNDTFTSQLAAAGVSTPSLFMAIIIRLLEGDPVWYDLLEYTATLQEIFDSWHRQYLILERTDPIKAASMRELDRNALSPRPSDMYKTGLLYKAGQKNPPICDPATGLPRPGQDHGLSDILGLTPPKLWTPRTLSRLDGPLLSPGDRLAELITDFETKEQEQHVALHAQRTEQATVVMARAIDVPRNGKGWDQPVFVMTEAERAWLRRKGLDSVEWQMRTMRVIGKTKPTIKKEVKEMLEIFFQKDRFWDT